MAELTSTAYENEGVYEDEFGIGLKLYLGARFVFYLIGVFMILGALLCVGLGITMFEELYSSATAVNATQIDSMFTGYMICSIVQAVYTIASAVCVAMLYIKRSKLFAFIDLGLFVILAAVMFVMVGGELLFNGSAWIFYFLLNPIFSFIALFAGKHFNYMPMM